MTELKSLTYIDVSGNPVEDLSCLDGMDGLEIRAETETTTPDREAVVWSDARMEWLIRKGLGRPEGEIYTDELAAIAVLRIDGDAVAMCESVSQDSGVIVPEPLESETIQSLED